MARNATLDRNLLSLLVVAAADTVSLLVFHESNQDLPILSYGNHYKDDGGNHLFPSPPISLPRNITACL
jgi:hypothetical protein